MIKAVTMATKTIPSEMSTEVTIDGTGREILYEFVGIVRSMRLDCPELLNIALRICKEELE